MRRVALTFWHVSWSAARPGPLSRLLAIMALHRSRRDLAALDDHLLRDVGLTRGQALREAGRPAWDGAPDRFSKRPWAGARERSWDAPSHWLADRPRRP